ncbi:MAG: sigma-70 family RNA polymerase sigma factor [Bacteroidetes bacterium]|nr:MAG: sigma-70 family RNA polymerase sigma factor [Bacteroidota bacterium]
MLTAFLMSATSNPAREFPAGAIALSARADKQLRLSAEAAEAALIRQAIGGDQSAYAALVRRYEHMVYGLVYRMVGHHEDALEVAQDAFLKAFRFLPKYRGESRFSTWLYHIARTSAINRLRKVRRTVIALDAPESPVRHQKTDMPDGYRTIVASERATLLREAFNQLMDADATVLTLFYLQEQSLEEICAVMDWTMSNAKSRLCRARQRLRAVLVEHYADEFSEWI